MRAAFAQGYDEIAAKLLTDVCGFLVAAADLQQEFRAQAQRILLEVGNGAETDDGERGTSAQLTLPNDLKPQVP